MKKVSTRQKTCPMGPKTIHPTGDDDESKK